MARSRSRLNKYVLFTLLAAVSTLAPAQTRINFRTVEKEVVLARVQDAPNKNAERQQKVKALFEAAGCSGQVIEQKVKHTDYSNVICKLPGETDETVIVGAHFDKVAKGTGIIDNWSGASLLATLYESLAAEKRHHTFLFVAFCEEEKGLVGSDFYASNMSKEDVSRTEAVVNMDTLGLSPTKIWVHSSDKNLVDALVAIAHAMNLPVSGMNVENVGSTDSESFAPKHIPRITVHSVTQQTWAILHTDADTLKELHPDEYYDTYRLLSGYLAYLDGTLQPRKPGK